MLMLMNIKLLRTRDNTIVLLTFRSRQHWCGVNELFDSILNAILYYCYSTHHEGTFTTLCMKFSNENDNLKTHLQYLLTTTTLLLTALHDVQLLFFIWFVWQSKSLLQEAELLRSTRRSSGWTRSRFGAFLGVV